MEEEEWRTIPEFPTYSVSNLGNIFNTRDGHPMRNSRTQHGHVKITLVSEWDGARHTRSVAQLVAEAFVERPNVLCDQVVEMDGDLANVAASNLAWRPRWFAWKYARQVRTDQPMHYKNLPVVDLTTGVVYGSIVEAGIANGLLFKDIWESTYSRKPVFPYGSVFEVVERV